MEVLSVGGLAAVEALKQDSVGRRDAASGFVSGLGFRGLRFGAQKLCFQGCLCISDRSLSLSLSLSLSFYGWLSRL